MARIQDTTEEQREAFAAALAVYLERKGWRAADLVRALRDSGLPVHQASMSQWQAALHEPPRAVVVEMERALNLRAGLLTRHLGYLPLTGGALNATDVESAVLADRLLSADQRQALIATYRALRGF